MLGLFWPASPQKLWLPPSQLRVEAMWWLLMCHKVQFRGTSPPSHTIIITTLKEWICSQHETVQEYNSLPGEDVLLTDRYTQLLIVEKHRQQEEREKEIRIRGPSFFGARTMEYKSTTVEQFFRPNDRGDVPKAVILQGNSGHGKSFTTQKIILDWASGSLYQGQFELILHLRCNELNHMFKEGAKKSVVDVVSCSEKCTPLVLKNLKDSPQKVLFIIDGFDELQFPVSEIHKSSVKDLSTPAPVEAILSALLKGSVLSECFLLVSTRPTASDKLSKLLKRPQRCTEILGFSEEGVHEYFKRFCKNEQVWRKALSSLKANETLFTSCFIPVICWIVCIVFKEQLQKNVEMTDGLETTTSIFVHFVSILLKHHCQGLGQPVPDLLRSLGQLAERGIREQQVLFEKESVLSTVSDPASVPFLCKFLLKERVEMKEMFSFMHLSFQEFFTALHYTSDQDEERVKELLRSIKQHEDRAHLLPIIQFLFGLSNVKVMQDLRKLQLKHNPSMQAQLKEWVIKLIENNEDSGKSDMMLFALHCLYELHEEEFVRRAMEAWGVMTFESIPLTRTDCWVLLYCLQCCLTIRSLQLTDCNITAEKLRMLQPALSRCQELGLDVCNLSDVDVSDLISAVEEGKTLSHLGVQNSSLSDESVQQVLSALCRQESVGGVWLSVKTITLSTAESLLCFLKSTQTVELVGLAVRNFGDSSPESESSGMMLAVILPEISAITLREITCGFQQLRRLEENSLEYDGRVDGLMAYVSSLPDLKGVSLEYDGRVDGLMACVSSLADLKGVGLWAGCLTEVWANRILSLIRACPHLHQARSLEYDGRVDGLMACVSSLADLKGVGLWAGCLTEVWANRILSLIRACPHLHQARFEAAVFDEEWESEAGLLLEEGIHLLQEAQMPPGCTITLEGKRCRKTVDPCRRRRDWKLSCNEEVEMEIPSEEEESSSEEEMEIPSEEEEIPSEEEMEILVEEETAGELDRLQEAHRPQKKKKKKCALM
ncbi:hypothetical protein ACEWY4_017502 [Coilia grayii]|uniref:NACHT domain-containing protein n=1 Tax=Coilia grayii TaxID=363190 RepID=A0ABD1JH14_9TELE